MIVTKALDKLNEISTEIKVLQGTLEDIEAKCEPAEKETAFRKNVRDHMYIVWAYKTAHPIPRAEIRTCAWEKLIKYYPKTERSLRTFWNAAMEEVQEAIDPKSTCGDGVMIWHPVVQDRIESLKEKGD